MKQGCSDQGGSSPRRSEKDHGGMASGWNRVIGPWVNRLRTAHPEVVVFGRQLHRHHVFGRGVTGITSSDEVFASEEPSGFWFKGDGPSGPDLEEMDSSDEVFAGVTLSGATLWTLRRSLVVFGLRSSSAGRLAGRRTLEG